MNISVSTWEGSTLDMLLAIAAQGTFTEMRMFEAPLSKGGGDVVSVHPRKT